MSIFHQVVRTRVRHGTRRCPTAQKTPLILKLIGHEPNSPVLSVLSALNIKSQKTRIVLRMPKQKILQYVLLF